MVQSGILSVSSQPPHLTRQYVTSDASRAALAIGSRGLPRSLITFSGNMSCIAARTNGARVHDLVGTDFFRFAIGTTPRRDPSPSEIKTPNGQACNPKSSEHELTFVKINARPSSAVVAARPPRLARLTPDRRVSMAVGAFYSETRRGFLPLLTSGRDAPSPPDASRPNPSTRKSAPLQDAPLCLFSSSLNLAHLPIEARQRFSVQDTGIKPVGHAADYLLRPEVHGNQLAHVVAFKSAGKPVRPVSVIHQ